MTIRNELLEQICIAYGGVTEGVNTMDGYLLSIANAVGAEVRYPHIRNFLLEDILKVFNPAY